MRSVRRLKALAITEDLLRAGHPEISRAMNELQHARYVLQAQAASDYHGHKANAIGYIDKALGELQTCMSMP